jgi:transcriptional regulator with XRE-family HTH domain
MVKWEIVQRRLLKLREALGLSGGEAAAAAGVSGSYVYNLEGGYSTPGAVELIANLAQVYGTSVDYILGLTDDPTPPQGEQWPEGAEEMLRLMRDLAPARIAELIGVARIMLEAQRKRAKTDADTLHIAEHLRRLSLPAETEKGMMLVLTALRDGDEATALAVLRDILAREGDLPQGAANGPLAQKC